MKAMYAGSFDPFTNGHLDILKESCTLFEEVHLIIGINSEKKRSYPLNEMLDAIEKVLNREGISNCIVGAYDGLTAKYCKLHGINYLVRGLRNSMDYNYEENIAEVNRLINPTLSSIYFRAKNAGISSSMVRELYTYGEVVNKYVPPEIYELMQKHSANEL